MYTARPFRTGRGSYDVILGNLAAVAGLVDLQLGGNFTEENWRAFPSLFDDLAAAGLAPEAFSDVRFDPVFREAEGIAPPDMRGGCSTLDEPWVLEASVALREETLRRGYPTGRLLPSRCMVDFPGRPVINFDGGLYGCAGFIGREECRVGAIGAAPPRRRGRAVRSALLGERDLPRLRLPPPLLRRVPLHGPPAHRVAGRPRLPQGVFRRGPRADGPAGAALRRRAGPGRDGSGPGRRARRLTADSPRP